jgi:uncharacterized protein
MTGVAQNRGRPCPNPCAAPHEALDLNAWPVQKRKNFVSRAQGPLRCSPWPFPPGVGKLAEPVCSPRQRQCLRGWPAPAFTAPRGLRAAGVARHHSGRFSLFSQGSSGSCVRREKRQQMGIVLSIFSVIFWYMDSNGSITTYSGVRFWPLLPNRADIRIEDIAHALSNQCRFAGHAREFYSVAEHCVRVSQHCRPEDALWGLLHDASEAYLSDVPAPMKELPAFEAYRVAERSLQGLIAQRFGLSTEQPRSSVTEADRAVLEIEIRDLLRPAGVQRPERPPQKNRLTIANPWQPRIAKARFLSRFRELCRKL